MGFQTREKSLSYLRRVSLKVLCISRNTRNLVACLRGKSVASLLNLDVGPDLLNWLPTNEMENDDAFLTDTPKNLVNNNAMKDLPFISGAVADEGLLITQSWQFILIYSNQKFICSFKFCLPIYNLVIKKIINTFKCFKHLTKLSTLLIFSSLHKRFTLQFI